MKLSARNQLKGKVLKINEGAVNSIVTIELDAGLKLRSVITIAAVKELGLEVGSKCYAVIKALQRHGRRRRLRLHFRSDGRITY